ncbi:MAG: hypothetical protein WAW73_17850 [Rhodoferax sp.]
MSRATNLNQVALRSTATTPARLPAIPDIQIPDRPLSTILKALKERSEVREGERGNHYEQVVTLREADELGLVRTRGTPCRVSELAGIVGQTKDGEFVLFSIEDLVTALKGRLP